jgi:branched-chain amino acid aminotransferase
MEAGTQLACLDGAVLPAEQATIPATDEGLLRGDGVFEVARVYGGRPFALEEHLERLGRSAAGLRLPADRDALRADAARILAAAGPIDGILRVVVTRGGRRLLLTEPLPALPASVRLGTVTYASTRVLDGIKSLSYAANMLATRLAQERGFDEALLVSPHGRVLEAPTSSIFWVADGRLLTPPLEDHILASITRRLVIELAGAQERPCTREDLDGAQEAFLASSVREVQAIVAVDERSYTPAPGPMTARTAERLRAAIEAELKPLAPGGPPGPDEPLAPGG